MAKLDQQRKNKVGVLQSRVARFLSEQELTSPGDLGVVAVSGGPDSLCLLHTLASLKAGLGMKFLAAHLDHGLRGDEGAADAEFVADTASSLGIPSVIEKRDVAGYRDKNNLSWEDAARRVRYRFLAEVAASANAVWVAVGHTADDQAETVLMHLLRGSGIYGLKGMEPVSPWPYPSQTASVKLIRPLLDVSRSETHGYCIAADLSPRLDTSNLLKSYSRNRVREELIPKLKEYNPRVVDALLRTSRSAVQQAELLDWALNPIWASLIEHKPPIMRIHSQAMAQLPRSLQVHALRRAIVQMLGDLEGIAGAHLNAVVKALAGRAGVALDLPRGLCFSKEYDYAILSMGERETSALPLLEGEYKVAVPGETLLPGWRIVTKLEGPGEGPPTIGRWQARLDYARVGANIIVRPRRPGDRFHPQGMDGTKKLQDFMVDAHIPRGLRGRVPILASEKGIIWVAGWRTDHRVQATQSTGKVLFIEMQKDPVS